MQYSLENNRKYSLRICLPQLTRTWVCLASALALVFGVGHGTGYAGLVGADQALIVDCLLPGKVKQLGLVRTYLSRKRPAKLPSHECAIRGGEYVKYDRANMASALAVWQESASLGDATAQYYIGEIFEQGMEQEPNYDMALMWYQQSAKQGFGPALMSLGRLYEAGMGVEKNLVTAMNYYREASGLQGEQIAYASVFEQAIERGQAEINELSVKLAHQQQSTTQLHGELDRLKKALSSSNTRVEQLEHEVETQQRNIDRLTDPEASDEKVESGDIKPDPREMAALEAELLDAQNRLKDQQRVVASLNEELRIVKADSGSSRVAQSFVASEVEQAKQALQLKQSEAIAAQASLDQLTKRITSLGEAYKDYTPKKQLILAQKLLAQERAKIREYEDRIKEQIKRDEKKVTELEQRLANATAEQLESETSYRYRIDGLKQQLATSQSALDDQTRQLQILEKDVNTMASLIEDERMDKAQAAQSLSAWLSSKEQYYRSRMQGLKKDLQSREAYLSRVERRLGDVQQKNESKQQYIARLEAAIKETNERMIQVDAQLQEKDISLSHARAQIAQLDQSLSEAPTGEQLRQLSDKLKDSMSALNDQRKVSAQLTREIAKLESDRGVIQTRLDKVIPQEGPVIAFRWPQSITSDKDSDFSVSVNPGSIVNIVGAVSPSALIDRFEIDGEPHQLDANGLFLKTVEVNDGDVKVAFAATDDRGRERYQTLKIRPNETPIPGLDADIELTSPKVDFGNYYALVIGNNQYQTGLGWPNLNTAVNDAKVVASLLEERYDFNVTLKENATRDELLLALEEMRKKLTRDDNLVIYYAGHGYMDPQNDQGYWIPVNGAVDSTVNWISNATITDQIRAMNARNVMVIADSCYSGSLMRSGLVSLRSGLSKEKRQERIADDVKTVTRVALSSGGVQPVVDAIGGSSHSVFADALLTVLEDNYAVLDGDSLAIKVGSRVAAATEANIQQVPRYAPLAKGGHMGGEFYFVPK